MFDTVKSWGVWLETIEITGVEICSQSLFRDMQTNYRETMRQQATFHAMEVKSELDQVRSQNSITVAEKEREINDKRKQYFDRIDMEMKEDEEKFLLEKANLLQEKEKTRIEMQLWEKAKEQELDLKYQELNLQVDLARDENDMKIKEDRQRLTVEKRKTEEKTLAFDLENKKISKDSTNELKIADMEMEKRNIDGMMLRHKALELAKASFNGQTFT